MAILADYEKQPADVQDYDLDFEPYLTSMGEAVGAAHEIEVTVPTGITLGTGGQAPSITDGVAKAWLSGGTSGQRYIVAYTITTAGGRTHQQEIELKVKEY